MDPEDWDLAVDLARRIPWSMISRDWVLVDELGQEEILYCLHVFHSFLRAVAALDKTHFSGPPATTQQNKQNAET